MSLAQSALRQLRLRSLCFVYVAHSRVLAFNCYATVIVLVPAMLMSKLTIQHLLALKEHHLLAAAELASWLAFLFTTSALSDFCS